MIDKISKELLKASIDLNSKELIYEISWWFGTPSHSLKISDVELFNNYDIPSGWNGIGEKELSILERNGFLKKISETINEKDPLEKKIIYIIN
ncbi:hypothetical protein L21SP5_00207 [Salinivirga cyanobacteriivorans]|uniref:Uncharacterized protein n=1 Tax=Salinivirga cyanobacteriivorans TaxID=1307839 RepID=A0A0S2HV21_9BACT|nr:hypothetical protein [Salinivirga cyanobacteriivorans]ALO13887.1 hypothetical protein L21SP5_00207 [Salinivirga cyanobacteriivorans]